MPVHAIDHSISRKDGVNHNMLVLLNNFWIGLSTSQSYAGCSATKILADLDQSLHPLGFLRVYRWPRIAVSDGGLRAG